MRSWSGGGSQQTGLFTHPRNESNGWKPRRNLIRRMTTLGRQRGEACLLESWQTQKIRGEAEVRSTQRSSLSQTVVWLAITSVLLTQSIIPVGAIRGQFPSASSSLSNGAVMLEARGGGLFPVESLSWLRVSVCLLTGWPPAKLNCPWKICSNYWRLQGTITEIWKYGTLKTGGEPLVESTFELLLPWCLYPLRGLNNYHNPPIGTIEQVDIWPKEDTDNEARDATLHLLLVTHWAYAGPRSIAHSKKLSRSHVIQS